MTDEEALLEFMQGLDKEAAKNKKLLPLKDIKAMGPHEEVLYLRGILKELERRNGPWKARSPSRKSA